MIKAQWRMRWLSLSCMLQLKATAGIVTQISCCMRVVMDQHMLCKINDQGLYTWVYMQDQWSRIKVQGLYMRVYLQDQWLRSRIKDQGSRDLHASLSARSRIKDQGSRFQGSTCESLWKINDSDQGSRIKVKLVTSSSSSVLVKFGYQAVNQAVFSFL